VTARGRVALMNALFAAGLALILPWLAAGALAHWPGPARGTHWATHHSYAARSFWIGLMGGLAGLASGLWPLLFVTWAWCAVRIARQWAWWDDEAWIRDPGRFF